jgi:hypothetical protein
MSVIMVLRARGDANELERRAAENPERMQAIMEKAKAHGLIGHRFFGTDDGQIMVADEWPDPESFQAFWQEMQSEIEPLMRDAGVTEEPEVTFWRRLETHDEFGWHTT